MRAQVLADVLDRPVHRVAEGGCASSFGTAMFGFDHLDVASADDLADRLTVADVSEPDAATRARYADLYGAFAKAARWSAPVRSGPLVISSCPRGRRR